MTTQIALDDLDEKIIQLFQKDGRSSNRLVARTLKISEGAVRKRLKRLIEAGAISYGLVLDTRVIDLQASAWMKVAVRQSQLRNLANFIGNLDRCSLCCLTTGEQGLQAYIYGRDRIELAEFAASIGTRKGVLSVELRDVYHFFTHRYELMLPTGGEHARWKVT